MAAPGGGAGAGSWESAVSGDYPVSNGRQGAHFPVGLRPGFRD